MTETELAEIRALEARVRTLLPVAYQDVYEDVQPVSMGSAGLKFGPDGKVAWDQIWGSFCDLAMAGGPPHKGTLLEPGSGAAVAAQPEAYRLVVEELCRGITLVTGLSASSARPGWVQLACQTEAMAGWLARAITMENISARCEGLWLELPAGPDFRLEKEIKNVVTSIAKTCHYWLEHMEPEQHLEIAALLDRMNQDAPLLQIARNAADLEPLKETIAATIAAGTGLQRAPSPSLDWIGFDCRAVRPAVWRMRALLATNVLARREGTVLFVPVNPELDPTGQRVAAALQQVHRFALARKVG